MVATQAEWGVPDAVAEVAPRLRRRAVAQQTGQRVSSASPNRFPLLRERRGEGALRSRSKDREASSLLQGL